MIEEQQFIESASRHCRGLTMDVLKGSPLRIVFSLALGSRIVVVLLFLFWQSVTNPYDTSADLSLPCLSHEHSWDTTELPVWGQRLGKALEKTIVWDGVYYVRIAECGYEYEQVYAFLPALPLLMRFLTRTIFCKLVQTVGLRATLALSGYIINNGAFIIAAYFLYRLSEEVLKDEKLAIQAVALFCFNPASTFYSAIYSESLFTLFSFSGLLYFLGGARWTAVALFGLSSGVRSNGVLHAGFILFQAMHITYDAAIRRKEFMAVVPTVIMALFQSAVVAGPFIAFQGYGYSSMCLQETMLEARPWCKATVPYLYGFVQRFYWDVGFLRYFQFKQIPNFLLASPMLTLAFCAIVNYTKHQPRLFYSLGLAATSPTQAKEVALIPLDGQEIRNSCDEKQLKKHLVEELSSGSLHDKDVLKRRIRSTQVVESLYLEAEVLPRAQGFHSPAVVCFLIQLAFMVATAMLVMHVQVATRFLSVSPPIFWYGAYLMNSDTRHNFGHLIWAAFFCYISVGSLLFINFYPFT